MKIAPVPLGNGNSIVYVFTDQNDPADGLMQVHETLAGIQAAAYPHFSAVSPRSTPAFHRSANDSPDPQMHTEGMNDITRDELRSTLSEIENRMDRRIDRLADEFRNEMALRAEADQREAVARSEAVQAHLSATKEMTGRLERDFLEVISATKAQKYWLAGIGVAVVLGIMGANATIFSGGKAFFDGGVDHAAVKQLLEETKNQTQETRALLESLKSQQAASAAPHPPAEVTK